MFGSLGCGQRDLIQDLMGSKALCVGMCWHQVICPVSWHLHFNVKMLRLIPDHMVRHVCSEDWQSSTFQLTSGGLIAPFVYLCIVPWLQEH